MTPGLDGGNSNIFYVHPDPLGKMNPILTSIFFRWVGKKHQPGKIKL